MPLLKYLQEVFHLRKRGMEAFRVMPFVQLRILNLLGISCGWSARGCVCAGVFFSLSHTRMQKYACTKTHTYGVFHLRCEARPPSAFLTCNHVQICTGRQGEGESHVNLCGCFLFFFVFFCLITADLRRPRSKSPSVAFQTPSSKTFSSLSFFNRKRNLALGRGETLYLPSNKYIKCKECREKSSLLERLQGNLVNNQLNSL